MSLFDRQLVELKAFAPSPAIRDTYVKLEGAWSDYKEKLIGKARTEFLAGMPTLGDALRQHALAARLVDRVVQVLDLRPGGQAGQAQPQGQAGKVTTIHHGYFLCVLKTRGLIGPRAQI